MDLFLNLKATAIAHKQRIVLPESTEPRTLKAAEQVIAEGIADITLIGEPAEIMAKAEELNLTHIGEARIVNPNDDEAIQKYVELFYELRKSKGISMEDAKKTTKNPLYLGCLLVKAGEADGQVAGAANSTGNVLRAAFQVIKTHCRFWRIHHAIARRMSFRTRRNLRVCRLCSNPCSYSCRTRTNSRFCQQDC